MAFKAVDEKGRGVDVEGSVWSSYGDLVTMFRSVHLGMGSFSIKPEAGLNYHAIVSGPGNAETRVDLPGSFASGVTLSAVRRDGNNLSGIARTNEQTLSVLKDKDLKLIISVRQEIINTILLKISSLSSALTLPVNDLPEGIIMLTLTSSEDLPLAERLIFVEHNPALSVNILASKEEFKQREPVTLSVSVSGDHGQDETAFLSLSATDGIYTDNPGEYKTSISSWFLLESDVKGPVKGPAYYFDRSNPDRTRDLDLLLMTQGWRDFSWKFNTINYFTPENEFHISGQCCEQKRPAIWFINN